MDETAISAKNCTPRTIRDLATAEYFRFEYKAPIPHRTELDRCRSVEEKTERILETIDVVKREDVDFAKLTPFDVSQLMVALQQDLDYLAEEVVKATNSDIARTGRPIRVSSFSYAAIDDDDPQCSVATFHRRLHDLGKSAVVIKQQFVNPFPIADYTNIDQDYKGTWRVPEFESSSQTGTQINNGDRNESQVRNNNKSLVKKTAHPFNCLLKECEKYMKVKKDNLGLYAKPQVISIRTLRNKHRREFKEVSKASAVEEKRREEEEWCEQGMPTNVEDISELPLQFTGDLKTLRKFRLQGPPREDEHQCADLDLAMYNHYNPTPHVFSRKIFVGGIAADWEERELRQVLGRFGPFTVDWPVKGAALNMKERERSLDFVFLIFEYEQSVRSMIDASETRDGRYYLSVTLKTGEERTLQIGPWRLHDAEYIVNPLFKIPMRNIVFVGGVPRTLRAVDIAHIFDRIYGPVIEAGVDTDLEHHYPKGAARITFIERRSFIQAIRDRCIYISHCGTERLIDIKPYVLDDVPCDECLGAKCTGQYADFFCPDLKCLQYYCRHCWDYMHSISSDRQRHEPVIKEDLATQMYAKN
ncbi:hypothetical protein QR680_016342 [Steinernema hermaphroditum]|uniref:Cytoplasmic polyadenylation element-binding protein 1 n=1 Tax=Steinernema hermaphroditum TaxID=289476 RepID=A0AA39LM73_9BILA|nr:hypothetical protein QR680_016342 [Steinernema hermaphroditum]